MFLVCDGDNGMSQVVVEKGRVEAEGKASPVGGSVRIADVEWFSRARD